MPPSLLETLLAPVSRYRAQTDVAQFENALREFGFPDEGPAFFLQFDDELRLLRIAHRPSARFAQRGKKPELGVVEVSEEMWRNNRRFRQFCHFILSGLAAVASRIRANDFPLLPDEPPEASQAILKSVHSVLNDGEARAVWLEQLFPSKDLPPSAEGKTRVLKSLREPFNVSKRNGRYFGTITGHPSETSCGRIVVGKSARPLSPKQLGQTTQKFFELQILPTLPFSVAQVDKPPGLRNIGKIARRASKHKQVRPAATRNLPDTSRPDRPPSGKQQRQVTAVSDAVELVEVSAFVGVETAGQTTNFLLRWGLNRQGGCVVVSGISAQLAISALRVSEKQVQEAIEGNDSVAYPRRRWVLANESLLPFADIDGLLDSLKQSSELSSGEARKIRKHDERLGLVVEIHNQSATLDAMLSSSADAISTWALFCILIVPAQYQVSPRLMDALAGQALLPIEVLRTERVAVQISVPISKTLFPGKQGEGVALGTWCQYILQRGGENALEDGRELFDFASSRLRGAPIDNASCAALPRLEEVLADTKAAPQMAQSLLQLICHYVPELAADIVQAMARDYATFGIAPWRIISERPLLVDAWLGSVPQAYLNELPRYLLRDPLAQRTPLEGLIGSAVRAERRGLPIVSTKTIDQWIRYADSDIARVVEAARGRLSDGAAPFWKHANNRSLRLLSEFAPRSTPPVDQVPPSLWDNPVFWRLVETAPLSKDLIRRMARLPRDARAVFGFCTSSEWKELGRQNHLGRSLVRLRGPISS